MAFFAKILIIIGIVFIIAGLLMYFLPKFCFLGKLPGDIFIKKEKFVLYFPITTSIIISIILSLLFWIIRK